MYKIIFSDVDGTLNGPDLEVPQENKDAILKAEGMGVPFILCSGRSYSSLKTIHKDIGIDPKNSFVIGFNGGTVYDIENNKVVYQDILSKEIAIESIEIFKKEKRPVEVFIYLDEKNVLTEEGSKWAEEYKNISQVDMQFSSDILGDAKTLDNIIKVIFLSAKVDGELLKSSLLASLEGRADVVFSSEYILEVGPLAASKGNALKWLCAKKGISLDQVIAIGDNYNDLTMIEAAGMGVAVANAVDHLKDLASFVTTKESHQGAVAEVIERFIL